MSIEDDEMDNLMDEAEGNVADVLAKYSHENIVKIPEGPDRDAVAEACAECDKITDEKERAARWVKIVKEASGALAQGLETLTKSVGKAVLSLALIVGLSGAACAQLGGKILEPATKAGPSILMAMDDMLSRTRAGYLLSIKEGVTQHSAAAYAPIFWFHRKDKRDEPFFEIGLGVESQSRDNVRSFIVTAFNLGEVIRRVLSGGLSRHASAPDFSPFFFGPVLRFPLNDLRHMRPKEEFALSLSVRVGRGS